MPRTPRDLVPPVTPRALAAARRDLVADLLAFVRAAGPTPLTPPASPREAPSFEALAARVLAYQAAAVPPYGRLVAADGGLPSPGGWRAAPLVPTELFRDLDLSASPALVSGLPQPQAVFRTSGTTSGTTSGANNTTTNGISSAAAGAVGDAGAWGADARGPRGVRRVPDLTLYDAAMEAPFVQAVLGGGPSGPIGRPAPWICLIPPATTLGDSSLSHMVTTLAGRLAAETTWATGPRGLEATRAWEALEAAAGRGTPVVLLATSFALVQLLDAAPHRQVRLPVGSRAMLTGGFKGRARTLEPAELLALAHERLGLGPDAVADEYGMTELTSQAYAARAGEPLVAPPWLRLRVVDPLTLEDLPPGRQGLVAFFDLLNLDNVSALLTSDLGTLDAAGGLTLHGRAPGAPARGCSLTAEELGVR